MNIIIIGAGPAGLTAALDDTGTVLLSPASKMTRGRFYCHLLPTHWKDTGTVPPALANTQAPRMAWVFFAVRRRFFKH